MYDLSILYFVIRINGGVDLYYIACVGLKGLFNCFSSLLSLHYKGDINILYMTIGEPGLVLVNIEIALL